MVNDDSIISLYLNCNAVIMHTYCGPTNLPIYESFYFKKVIFCKYQDFSKIITNSVSSLY